MDNWCISDSSFYSLMLHFQDAQLFGKKDGNYIFLLSVLRSVIYIFFKLFFVIRSVDFY